ncbi:MAG: copper transport protein [Actinomycetota bacterium]|nr:copper transport protein [Actinomycetota bacterium]
MFVGLVLALLVVVAPAASAHAILLRTEPSPQTTVDRPPPAVKLHFSEAVEAAFGAVRVYDVDGHRVDTGKLARVDGGREVDAAVPHLADGTYTVTWRVVSADGHAVHGGFGFYVGAPSTISAVAVAGDEGAGTAVGWGFGATRFVWFSGLLGLIGLVVARRWVWTPAVAAVGLADSNAAARFRRRFGPALVGAWAALAVAGSLALVFQAANVSGLSLAASAHLTALRQVLTTSFGHLWIAQMVLTVALGVPVLALTRRGRPLLGLEPPAWAGLLLAGTGGLCLVAALNGHARTLGRPAVAVASVAVHLLAVGVWVGGLAALVALGGAGWRSLPTDQRPTLAREVISRFSRLAVVAMLVVVATGVLNAVLDLASVSDLWRIRYGQLIVVKVALLTVALVLAARHRWTIPHRLASAGDGPVAAVRSFDRSAAAELVALVAAVAVAAGLVALVPGRSLALVANGPVNVERRSGASTVQLFIDPTAVGANQVHLTYVDAQGLGAAGVTNTDVTLGPAGGGLEPVAMRLISPGHFVGDVNLPAPGAYRLVTHSGTGIDATFDFRIRGTQSAPPTTAAASTTTTTTTKDTASP